MWIVRLALRRPYTFVVAALLVVILGVVVVLRMPTDIFPDIDIPVISAVFRYGGMTPGDMETRIVSNYERFLITVVNDIDHIESQSLNGISVVKIFFQKNASIAAATAQVATVSTTAIHNMPPGTQPPLIIRYNATSVPILQVAISSDSLTEQQIFDLAINSIRPQLITIPGIEMPYPYGGKQRQIMVDIDPVKLHGWGLSPSDISKALNAQNVILPAGSAKIGVQEYPVLINSSPDAARKLNDIPIKVVHGTTVYMRDVAHVRDGYAVQTNIVHVGGKRGVVQSILKSGSASTLDVVRNVKAALTRIKTTLPPDVKIKLMFDQSLFVRGAVEGVVREAAVAAALTGLMILLFLGSWRSTLIVMISIPLSILVSLIILGFLGETLNVMTLGGMALVVGMLVDDATVEIENIHRNLHMKKRLVQAILDGAQQIAVPAFVSTLCICIVFVPVVFISGAAKYLFTPLAMAVVFAMMASYLISRTLVPTMVHYLLAAEVEKYGGVLDDSDPHAHQRPHPARSLLRVVIVGLAVLVAVVLFAVVGPGSWAPVAWLRNAGGELVSWAQQNPVEPALWAAVILGAVGLVALGARYELLERYHRIFDAGFEKLRRFYGGLLAWCLEHRWAVVVAFAALLGSAAAILPLVGEDFFPSVDAGLIRLHVRAPAGTRIEQTEQYMAKVADVIRDIIPRGEVAAIIDNIGIPNSGINLSLSDGTMMSAANAEVMISLRENHAPTHTYIQKIGDALHEKMPELTIFFQPPDMVTQVLNFGLSAPIDIQIAGSRRNNDANLAYARSIMHEVAAIPGARDVRLQQVTDVPDLRVNVDRTEAAQMGLTQQDVAQDLLISLSSSEQTAPNWWLDPHSGVSYQVMVQTPQYRIDSFDSLAASPILGPAAADDKPQLLANLATFHRSTSPANITHYDIKPTYDVQLNVRGTDLQSVASAVQNVLDRHRSDLPHGSFVTLRGQIQSMHESFTALGYGLIFAAVLVYLLMVVNFQSWLDPLIILMALPGALAGIVWILFVTHTTFSVPALMGAIMSIGVGTANSILMITFANEQRRAGLNAYDAALAAGLTRLRPVLMTAAAMLIGMLPMSLGLGDGGEQNAPLGRAVIGGLALATVATLIFVPVVYSALRKAAPQTQVEEELKE